MRVISNVPTPDKKAFDDTLKDDESRTIVESVLDSLLEDIPMNDSCTLYDQTSADDSFITIDETFASYKSHPLYDPISESEGSFFDTLEKTLTPNKLNEKRSKKSIDDDDSNDGLDAFPTKRRRAAEESSTSSSPLKSEVHVPKEKRMIVIDGSNVAFHHSNNKEFSVKGLSIAVDYFKNRGYEVKAIVPQFRMKKYFSTDQSALETLQQQNIVILTPSKNLPGQCSSSYDDRFILDVADKFDAAIISNDNYRDLLNEKPIWRKLIESRVIGYTWCNDMFFLPQDPYGRFGPKLDEILFYERKQKKTQIYSL